MISSKLAQIPETSEPVKNVPVGLDQRSASEPIEKSGDDHRENDIETRLVQFMSAFEQKHREELRLLKEAHEVQMAQLVSDSDTEMEIQDILQDAQHMRRDLDTHGRQERQGVSRTPPGTNESSGSGGSDRHLLFTKFRGDEQSRADLSPQPAHTLPALGKHSLRKGN